MLVIRLGAEGGILTVVVGLANSNWAFENLKKKKLFKFLLQNL